MNANIVNRIVGKGNHSVNHIQKIKPRVEKICQELNLQYVTEQNEGRMYINLQGGPAVMPPMHGNSGQYRDRDLRPQYEATTSVKRSQTPEVLMKGSDIEKNTTRNAMRDLSIRIKRRKPEVLALEMHGLSGVRELDMLSDGYRLITPSRIDTTADSIRLHIILASKNGLVIIDNNSFVGYHINTEELLRGDNILIAAFARMNTVMP